MKGMKVGIVAALAIIFVLAASATVSAGSYNRYAAGSYAEKYAENPNSAYRYFNKDCTNFVSQCLYAGGWTETGKYRWYSDYAWYYDWGARPGYSHTWTVANELHDFLGKSGRADQVLVSRPYYPKFRVGDIIQIDYKDSNGRYGWWDHSMIVTGIIISDDDLWVSYHTPNTKNKRLSIIKMENQDARFVGWHIRDNY